MLKLADFGTAFDLSALRSCSRDDRIGGLEQRFLQQVLFRKVPFVFGRSDSRDAFRDLSQWPTQRAFGQVRAQPPVQTLCGTPALSLPLLQGPNNMPLGAQLVSYRGDDARLFRTARWLVKSLEE